MYRIGMGTIFATASATLVVFGYVAKLGLDAQILGTAAHVVAPCAAAWGMWLIISAQYMRRRMNTEYLLIHRSLVDVRFVPDAHEEPGGILEHHAVKVPRSSDGAGVEVNVS